MDAREVYARVPVPQREVIELLDVSTRLVQATQKYVDRFDGFVDAGDFAEFVVLEMHRRGVGVPAPERLKRLFKLLIETFVERGVDQQVEHDDVTTQHEFKLELDALDASPQVGQFIGGLHDAKDSAP